MKRILIKNLLNSEAAADPIRVSGWVRTRRDAKGFSFLEVNDGSCLKNLQVIVDEAAPAFRQLKDVSIAACSAVLPERRAGPASIQGWKACGARSGK